MRKGNHPSLVLDKKNRLMAIATGADATSEHEWGSNELITALTGQSQLKSEAVAARVRDGSLQVIPDLMESRYITQDLDNIVYEEKVVDGVLVAAVVYDASHRLEAFGNRFIDSELRFNTFSEPKDIAGAWDGRSFGFKVKGEKLVAQLREFVKALKAGKAMFAGTFLARGSDGRLSGVIIARTDMLRPEHRAAMKTAQAEFEADVALHVKARTAELWDAARQLKGGVHIYSIRPVWNDGERDSEVRYSVNTGRVGDDSGPFAFAELHRWLTSGAKTALRVPAHA